MNEYPDQQPVMKERGEKNGIPEDERTWAWVIQLTGLSQLVGVPFGHIIIPLILWLIKKEGRPFVDEVGKEALNFQITYTIYAFFAFLSYFILIGFVLMPLLFVLWVVFIIVATLKAHEGTAYRFPGIIRFLK